MKLICNYMEDVFLRHALNTLTQKTFGFNFEDWVVNGCFEGDYIPYSFMEDGKILSNASANRMCFMQNGIQRNYIQIGTVMTDEAYRNKGLARKLVEQIIKEFESRCDGIYLFGDISALDFYRKLGFEEGWQHQYVLKTDYIPKLRNGALFRPVDKKDAQIKLKYIDAVRNSAVNSSLEQINKYGLQMFYTWDLSDLYYADDIDCFAVIEMWDDTLMLQSVICKEHLSLEKIIGRINMEYCCLKLGFTPCAGDAGMFEAYVYDGGEDYRMFYRGKELESIKKEKLFFPQMSHA